MVLLYDIKKVSTGIKNGSEFYVRDGRRTVLERGEIVSRRSLLSYRKSYGGGYPLVFQKRNMNTQDFNFNILE